MLTYATAVVHANVSHNVGNTNKNFLSLDTVKKVLVHGAVGGVSAELGGGSFKDGFVGAAGGQFASRAGLYGVLEIENPNGVGYLYNAVTASIVGGSISKGLGGSFETGAAQSLFGRMFNELSDHVVHNIQDDVEENVGSRPSEAEVRDMHTCKSDTCYFLKKFFGGIEATVEYKTSWKGDRNIKIGPYPTIENTGQSGNFDGRMGVGIKTGPLKIDVSTSINVETGVDIITGGAADKIRQHNRRLEGM